MKMYSTYNDPCKDPTIDDVLDAIMAVTTKNGKLNEELLYPNADDNTWGKYALTKEICQAVASIRNNIKETDFTTRDHALAREIAKTYLLMCAEKRNGDLLLAAGVYRYGGDSSDATLMKRTAYARKLRRAIETKHRKRF